MKFKGKIAAAVMAAAAAMAMNVPHASADVCGSCNGGMVVNQSSSSNKLLIYNGSSTASLYPGQVSERYTYFQDVDQFMSPYCDAQLWTSAGWGKVFKRGVWYGVADWDSLSVRVAWC